MGEEECDKKGSTKQWRIPERWKENNEYLDNTISWASASKHRAQTKGLMKLVGWSVSWLFNSTSTQKGQFVPTGAVG